MQRAPNTNRKMIGVITHSRGYFMKVSSHISKWFVPCQKHECHTVWWPVILLLLQKPVHPGQMNTRVSPEGRSSPENTQNFIFLSFSSSVTCIGMLSRKVGLRTKLCYITLTALTWQFGERRSQMRIVLSNELEMKVSSTGDMESAVTLIGKKLIHFDHWEGSGSSYKA